MQEKWIDIINYENLYQVSSFGNIRSKDRIVKYKNNKQCLHKARLRKPSLSEYRMIALSRDNIVRVYKISRLVASHFIEKKPNKNIVNHKDGNKYNDNIVNLEWVSYSENAIHAFNNSLNKKKNTVAGIFFEKRRQKWSAYIYRNNKNIFVGRFNSEKEAIEKREFILCNK